MLAALRRSLATSTGGIEFATLLISCSARCWLLLYVAFR
jgi:hypothetical protein